MRFLLGLALLLAASATPVLADLLEVDFTITYSPTDTTFNGTSLSGNVSFSEEKCDGPCGDPGGTAPCTSDLCPSLAAFDIGQVPINGAFSTTFFPPTPCLGDGTCRLHISFAGMAGVFQAFAFPATADLSEGPPTQDPDWNTCTGPTCPAPFVGSGPVVADDSTVVVGTWQVTGTPVAMAEPSEIASLALTVMGIFLFAWRRRWAVQN